LFLLQANVREDHFVKQAEKLLKPKRVIKQYCKKKKYFFQNQWQEARLFW